MPMPRLILASSSPRRRELLAAAGYRFDVVEPRPEAEAAGADAVAAPADYVADLALRKARDVVERIVASCNKEATLVLAADTVAVCGDEILGKPKDEADARRMLGRLSGRQHFVYTGITLAPIGCPSIQGERSAVVATELSMDPLTDEWLDAFLASGKWRGKAGAFGLQDGIGVVRVTEGSESNVVGLPMERLSEMLAECGVVADGG